MKKFLVSVFATIFLVSIAQVAIVLGMHAAVPAEYWLAEVIAVKEALANAQRSPKIIFLGGSSSLFAIDAARIEQALGRPAINFGLHAWLRLDRLFIIARRTSRRGDLLVLALEPDYYSCTGQRWSNWQVRNAAAWDRAGYFDQKPMTERIAAILEAGDPSLPIDAAVAWVQDKLHLDTVRKRREAFGQAQAQRNLTSIRAHILPSEFAYSAANLDSNGAFQNTSGQHYFGPGTDPALPNDVCAPVLDALFSFNREMAVKGVSIAIVNTPVLVEDSQRTGWMAAEHRFTSDLASIGLPVLDQRQDLFFPPAAFFDKERHLNAEWRERRTNRLIDILLANENKILPPAEPTAARADAARAGEPKPAP
jgi:hypothetical protein